MTGPTVPRARQPAAADGGSAIGPRMRICGQPLRVGIASPPTRRPDLQFAASRMAATGVGRELEVPATSSQTSRLQIRPPFRWPGSHGCIWWPTGVIRAQRRRRSKGLASLTQHPRGATAAARPAPDSTAPGSHAVSRLDSSASTSYCPLDPLLRVRTWTPRTSTPSSSAPVKPGRASPPAAAVKG